MKKVKITYCKLWNYKPKAVSLAEKIKKLLNIDSEILAGAKGIFDVEYPAGNLIFSKFKEFKFPNEEEVIEKINSLS